MPAEYSEAKDRLMMALAKAIEGEVRVDDSGSVAHAARAVLAEGEAKPLDPHGYLYRLDEIRRMVHRAKALCHGAHPSSELGAIEHALSSVVAELEARPTPPPAEKPEGGTVEGEMSRLIDHMSRYSGTQPVGWARDILALARADRERRERAIAVLRVASTANAEKAFDILMGRS